MYVSGTADPGVQVILGLFSTHCAGCSFILGQVLSAWHQESSRRLELCSPQCV